MKYQSVTNPDVIVDAVQFDPHKHPWPEGVIPHDPECKPKDMTWGYVDTDERRVHVMAGYYIVTDSLRKKHVYERESFEEAFRPVIAPVIAIEEKRKIGTPPQGGDATIPVIAIEERTTVLRWVDSNGREHAESGLSEDEITMRLIKLLMRYMNGDVIKIRIEE